jgi:hypothetical protein
MEIESPSNTVSPPCLTSSCLLQLMIKVWTSKLRLKTTLSESPESLIRHLLSMLYSFLSLPLECGNGHSVLSSSPTTGNDQCIHNHESSASPGPVFTESKTPEIPPCCARDYQIMMITQLILSCVASPAPYNPLHVFSLPFDFIRHLLHPHDQLTVRLFSNKTNFYSLFVFGLQCNFRHHSYPVLCRREELLGES